MDLQLGDRELRRQQRQLYQPADKLTAGDPFGERARRTAARSPPCIVSGTIDMTKRPIFASLLLFSSALVAPAALAQDASADLAPQPGEDGDVSIPGGGGHEIVVNGRFTPNVVRATP